MNRLTTIRSLFAAASLSVAAISASFGHCQIPCGIYDDDARFKSLAEHITTIEKSIALITELSAKSKLTAADHNQMVRWVANKEAHADELAEIVTKYFLQQRIKPAAEGDAAGEREYLTQVSLLHKLLVGAMKCKQQANTETTAALKKHLAAFQKAYPAK